MMATTRLNISKEERSVKALEDLLDAIQDDRELPELRKSLRETARADVVSKIVGLLQIRSRWTHVLCAGFCYCYGEGTTAGGKDISPAKAPACKRSYQTGAGRRRMGVSGRRERYRFQSASANSPWKSDLHAAVGGPPNHASSSRKWRSERGSQLGRCW